MAGVAEQAHAADCPTSHGRAPQERPLEERWRIPDHQVDVLVPALVVVGAFLGRAARSPGFDLPVVALHAADEIHHFAAVHWIVDHVRAGADPVGPDHARHVLGQALHRYCGAPSHDASELRLVVAEERLAYFRVHAVGADERIAAHLAAALEFQRDPAVFLRESYAPRVQMDGVGLFAAHGVCEHAEKIRAVHRKIGEAVTFDRHRAQIEKITGLTGVPEPY